MTLTYHEKIFSLYTREATEKNAKFAQCSCKFTTVWRLL